MGRFGVSCRRLFLASRVGDRVLQKFDEITPDNMARLTQGVLSDRASIGALLREVMACEVELAGGIDRNHEIKQALVVDVSPTRVRLSLKHIDASAGEQLFFNFQLEGHEYFFSATPVDDPRDDQIEIALPRRIYRSERRGRFRDKVLPNGSASHVDLATKDGKRIQARVINRSPAGIGIEMTEQDSASLPAELEVRARSGVDAEPSFARIRHQTNVPERAGWVQVGLSLSNVSPGRHIEIDRRTRILEQSPATRAWERAELFAAAVRSVPTRVVQRIGLGPNLTSGVPIVDYQNDRGETIRAIIDTSGDPRGAPAVVIPPAWGRTKETLLPLAATILETFRRAGQGVTVVRFDGTHRRGESHIDPTCRPPGEEYQHFTFSQAVGDIQSTIRFLDADERYSPSTIILATFSLAAIEGRRAVAADLQGRIGGWVCTVGMVDLQSALRAISGGIDFGYGLQRGVRFGRHELVGVVADMDHTGLDALDHNLVYIEDAKDDMAKIKVPITWIHGRHDGWMSIDTVQNALSCGQTENRRLIEVPTGHQLRTSGQALSTFQLIAEEVGSMALGRAVRPRMPSLSALARRQRAERLRLPKSKINVRGFWGDYLLGRDRRIGMQLLTATAAYRNLMEKQIDLLALRSNDRVADLGAGTGEFPLSLARRPSKFTSVRIDEVDYVGEALQRGSERLGTLGNGRIHVQRIVADLDGEGTGCIPLADSSYDAVLASLVVSYLSKPEAFLAEIHRILRPGGHLVVSTLVRDADISKLYVDGLAELQSADLGDTLEPEAYRHFDGLARDFLNDASKILDFEEQGRFQFWDPSEFSALVKRAGFAVESFEPELGDPPQAVVISARRH